MKVGIVTILFTDIVDFSELLEKYGDDVGDDIRRTHFRLLRDVVASRQGEEVKNLGDGLMAAFPSAVDALSCAVAVQQAVYRHNLSTNSVPIQIRVGLHAGEALEEEDDYFGQPVIIAKRLCDGARGGQIIASELVQQIVGSRGGFEFAELGWLAIKGVSTPVSGREVAWTPQEAPWDPAVPPHLRDVPTQWWRPGGPTGALESRGGDKVLRWGGLIVALAGIIGLALVTRSSGSDARRSELRSLVWARVAGDETQLGGPGDQRVNRVVAAGARTLVAVGSDGSGGDRDAAVWTSSDGLSWTRVEDPSLTGNRNQELRGVTPGGPGFVAVGFDALGGDGDAAVWTSRTGARWHRVEDADLGGDGRQFMSRVASAGPGLVAVGYEQTSRDFDAVVWTSPDGLSWRRAEGQQGAFGGPGDQEMRSVAQQGNRIVAVGGDDHGGMRQSVAVWVSSDGSSWARVPHDRQVFGRTREQTVYAVAPLHPGFIAVGWETPGVDRDAAIWTSPNGLTWQRLPQVEEVFGGEGNQMLHGIERFPEGVVAVGHDTSGGGSDAAAWVSKDGIEWHRIHSDEDVLGGDRVQQMNWVTGFGSKLIGAGWDASGRGDDAAFWAAELGDR